MNKFEINKTYTTRSACDYDCVFTFTVVGRTDKTVKIVGDLLDKPVSRKIYNFGNGESFLPYGSYSMAPSVSA